MSSASSSPAPDASAATAPSPAPAYDPQAVGKGFVKAYYNQLLAGEQEKLVNFYVPSTLTYLSHAEGQEMTTPVALEDYKSQLQTTNRWGKDDDETMGIVMHGMDVHQTSPDSLLVVVTAMMRFFKSTDSGRTERQKFFVQTFFLARQGAWGVQNDILRFLDPDATTAVGSKDKGSAAPATTETTKAAAASTEKKKSEPEPETPADDAEETEKAKSDDDAPGGGVEESKEEPPEEADEAETSPTVTAAHPESSTTKSEIATKDDKSKGDKNKGKKASPAPQPGSWASLVATGGSAPNTPSRKSVEKSEAPKDTATEPSASVSAAVKAKESSEPKSKAKTKGSDAPPAKSAPAAKSGGGGGRGGDRKNERTFNPDCTLVIKNLDKASQEDVIKLFTPFATSTKSRLVGAHVNTFRKLAFVDFDAVAPVMAALKQHAEAPIQWNGHVLEVDQKSAEQRARREAARGGSYNGDRNGSGGGGRGRGDRGSKRGSGSKGGGRGGK